MNERTKRKISEAHKEAWSLLTEEERREFIKLQSEGMRRYWKGKTGAERTAIAKKAWETKRRKALEQAK